MKPLKTYAEARDYPPVDWPAFIQRARNGEVTEVWWMNAQSIAGDWVTCACGNLCASIPREPDGTPIDNYLAKLGAQFFIAVWHREPERMAGLLERIEHRAAELLEEMATKKTKGTKA